MSRLDDNEKKIILFFVENNVVETTFVKLRTNIKIDIHNFYSAYLSLLEKRILKESLKKGQDGIVLIVALNTTIFVKYFLGLKYYKSAELLLFLIELAKAVNADKISLPRKLLKRNPALLLTTPDKTYYSVLKELRKKGFLKLEESEGKLTNTFYLSKVPELIRRLS